MRIALVNDMKLAVEALRRVVTSVPGHEVAWIAVDGAEAVAKCARDKPDLILMDLIMPVMNGVEATRRIMQETPCTILIVTATVEGNASKVFEAMGYGALDAVKTPVLGMDGQTTGGQELLDKIAILKRLLCHAGECEAPAAARPMASAALPNLVAIGASTGGPKALADILSRLPATIDAALVIVQHVNAEFVRDLANWLGGQTQLTVRLAQGGDALERGTVYLAASDNHLRLTPYHTLTYTAEPRDCPYRPSVDAFFNSAATCWPKKAIAVLLTGMGRDGAAGLLELRRAGWHTIAQDEKSSVIYGMPKAAAALGAAVEILSLDQIVDRIIDRVGTIAVPKGAP